MLACFNKSFNSIKRLLYTNYYKKLHRINSSKLTITGRCLIHGSGRVQFGNNVTIKTNSYRIVELYSSNDANLVIGDNCYINQGVHISCSKQIVIGSGCLLADEVLIIDNDYHSVAGDPVKSKPIILENNVWVASRAIILKGVHIGKGAVVGAGAVVTHDVPPRSLVVGNPARVVRQWDAK